MSRTERIDEFQQRHPAVGAPIATLYKFHDDQGLYLSALIAYYGFLSLFPLLLLLTSILGFVLQSNPAFEHRILDSTLRQFPVIGDQLSDPHGLRGNGVALVVSLLVAVYGALGVAHAIQNAMNVIWTVPRCRRANPLRLRLRSITLIAIAGLATILAIVLSGLASSATAFGADLSRAGALSIVLAAVVVNSGVFVIGFWICVTRDRSLRSLLPGALTAAVLWQILQLVGTAYVDRVVKGTDVAYGAFALVLGLMAWIFLAALVLVGSAEIDVVRYRHLYPRALLTPFTDNVELTSADQRTYTDIAAAQQFKGFESVTVSFTRNGSPFDAPVAVPAVTRRSVTGRCDRRSRRRGRRGRGAGRAPRRGVRGPRLGGPASGTSVASFVGTVAERTNAPALKAGGSQGPGVRIPPVPLCDVARHRKPRLGWHRPALGRPGADPAKAMPSASATRERRPWPTTPTQPKLEARQVVVEKPHACASSTE